MTFAVEPKRLTKTQIGILDFLVENEGRAFLFSGKRILSFGATRSSGEPAAQCNEVSIYFIKRFGWIEPVQSNLPGRYTITMRGRIARCKHRYRQRRHEERLRGRLAA